MNKIIIIVSCFVFNHLSAIGQSNQLDKKLEKVYTLADKGKIDEADEYLVKLLKENPRYGTGWDLLCKLRYKEFVDSKELDQVLGKTFTITVKDKDGKDVPIEDDSLAQNFAGLLEKMQPSELAYEKYKYTLRLATLMSQEAYDAAMLLRSTFIDPEIDTAVSKKALKYFNEAEQEFANKNYNNAAKLYKRAIDEQPDFYKARLYLGDCFYFMADYVNAIKSFSAAIDSHPDLLEPRKYLVDAYAKERLYEKALAAAIEGMTVYPDLNMSTKLDDAAYMNNQKLDVKWTPRGVLPNSLSPETGGILKYNDPDSLITAAPWTFYRAAMAGIKVFCNQQGLIVKTNSLTQSKYLEVYSWEQMLKNSSHPDLEEAKRIHQDGYLDCYVMITCFHFDFYDQYVDFVSKNHERIIEYYRKYLVTIK